MVDFISSVDELYVVPTIVGKLPVPTIEDGALPSVPIFTSICTEPDGSHCTLHPVNVYAAVDIPITPSPAFSPAPPTDPDDAFTPPATGVVDE